MRAGPFVQPTSPRVAALLAAFSIHTSATRSTERVACVMLVVTNRRVVGGVQVSHNQSLAHPQGAAAILAQQEMATAWPSPIRVLAHDFGLRTYGGPLPDAELRRLRHTRLSMPEKVGRVLMPGTPTLAEEATQREQECQAALIPLLAPLGLQHFAPELVKGGVAVSALGNTAPAMESPIREAARRAGMTEVDIEMLITLWKDDRGVQPAARQARASRG